MNPASLRDATADHLDRMDAAIRRAGITDEEPLAPVLAEWRRGLAWAGELTAQLGEAAETLNVRIEAAVTELTTAQKPLDPAALVRLEEAAATGAERRAAKMARTHNRRTILLTAAAFVWTALATGAAGFWWGRHTQAGEIAITEAGLSDAFRDGPGAAASWLNLMRSNDVATMLATCTGKAVVVVDGRRACGLGAWLDPPSNPPPRMVPAAK